MTPGNRGYHRQVRWVPLLGFACACNQWFGIDRTQLVDGPPAIDAAPPPQCPTVGTMDVPRFDIELTPIPARKCDSYVPTTGGTAIAKCNDDQYLGHLATGIVDDVLTVQALDPAPSYIYGVRAFPEGDSALLTYYTAATYETGEYRLIDGAWKLSGTPFSPPGAPGYYYETSTPSRGPVRRVMVIMYDLAYVQQLVEFELSNSVWTEKRRTPITDLGVSYPTAPSLSPDGLRLLFVASSPQAGGGGMLDPITGGGKTELGSNDNPVYYADRASLDDPFSPPRPIPTVPDAVSSPYLTEDCGRIYFSGLSTVWYLKQALP